MSKAHMASLNKVCLIGNVGREPELRTASTGAMVNIALATTDTWKDKNTGEKKEATEWHRLVFFRELAEIVGKHVHKGTSLYVEGKLKTRKFMHEGVEKSSTEIEVTSMQILGSREGAPAHSPATAAARAASAAPATPNGYRTGPGYQPSPTGRPKGQPDNAFDEVY